MTNRQTLDVTMPDQRRPWQVEMLMGLGRHRQAVVVAHRRAGKTEAVCVRLLMAALKLTRSHPAPLFAYVAPFLNQAKSVAWDRLKYYSRKIPHSSINESELSIKLLNGSSVRIFGADYPDRLRGLGFDGVVMDEVAQMRPETWPAVVRPALSDRRGWAVFIGTPKGQNLFYDLYQRALSEPDDWYCGMFRADQTGVLAGDELDKSRREMGDNLFRQEYLCDFTAANEDSFIDFTTVQEACRREPHPVNLAPLVYGLDPARFGDDRTALVKRRGLSLEALRSWRGADLMNTAALAAEEIAREKPAAVFVDSCGLGAGVVDRLRQLGHRVMAVNSGAKAAKSDKFFNLKAEMWDKMRGWLLEGGRLPDREDLRKDLLAPKYGFDHQNRLKIESKDDLKKRGLPSTDCADALALTFAYPVAGPERRNKRPHFAEMD